MRLVQRRPMVQEEAVPTVRRTLRELETLRELGLSRQARAGPA